MNPKRRPPADNHERAERFAESVWVRLFSRMAMIMATAALPLVGGLVAYFGNRTIVSLDDALKTINETASRVLVLQQQITDSGAVFAAQEVQIKTELDDHEARIRILEQNKVSTGRPR